MHDTEFDTTACPECGGALTITRTTIVCVDIDITEDDVHLGHVCPAVHLRDVGVVVADNKVEWLVRGKLIEVSSGDLSNDADEGVPDWPGELTVDGHGAVVLGEEVTFSCKACGWRPNDSEESEASPTEPVAPQAGGAR